MNLTATSTYSSARRRIRGHQITLAAGIALAATAAIGFAYQGSVSDDDVSRRPISEPAVRGENVAPRQVVYIVDSEARRQEVSLAANEFVQEYAGSGLPPVLVTAVVAEPGDFHANLLLATMAGELMHYAPNAQIVDLR